MNKQQKEWECTLVSEQIGRLGAYFTVLEECVGVVSILGLTLCLATCKSYDVTTSQPQAQIHCKLNE